MSAYTVRVNVTIQEDSPDGSAPRTYLNYSTDFRIQGETLSDIAPQIDGLIIAMKQVPHEAL